MRSPATRKVGIKAAKQINILWKADCIVHWDRLHLFIHLYLHDEGAIMLEKGRDIGKNFGTLVVFRIFVISSCKEISTTEVAVDFSK